MIDGKSNKTKKRAAQFTTRPATRIWQENPAADNPYLAAECRCHGYNILELAQQSSFVEVLFLLFQGELPNKDQARLLETLLISLINPGPRHPATRGRGGRGKRGTGRGDVQGTGTFRGRDVQGTGRSGDGTFRGRS